MASITSDSEPEIHDDLQDFDEEEEPEELEEEEPEEEPEELEEEPEELEEEEPEEEPEELEEEPEEEEEDPEEEEGPEEVEENGDDCSALDSHSTAKHNDSGQEVEPERDNEDMRFENFKGSLLGVRSTDSDYCDSVNPSNEPLGIHGKDTQVGVIRRVGEGGTSDVVSSEDNVFQESLSGNTVIKSHLENRIVIDSCIDEQRERNKECGNQNLSNNIVCTNDGENGFIPVDKRKIAAVSLMGDTKVNKVSDDNLLFKEETKQMNLLPRENFEAKTSRSITPQIRLRGLSPGATFEDGNKRPAVLCELFAGGWCVKGNSCKFFHHKDGVTTTSKCHKENAPTACSKDNLEENEGLRVDNIKVSVHSEILTSSYVYDQSLLPSKSSKPAKVVVSGENQRPHQFLDTLGMHMSLVPNISAGEWKSSAGEENIRNFGLSLHRDDHNHPNLMGYTRPDREEFVEEYTSSMNRLVPEQRSKGSLTECIYGNINPFASDKYGSHTSPTFFCSRNQTLPCDSLQYKHKWSGTALSRRPSLDGDQEYSSSRSLVLTHSLAPYNSRLDTKNLSLHDIPGSISSRLSARSNISNWEPSIPFRPSFSFSSFISSPRNQSDPLLDSIDSPDVSEKTFQVIQDRNIQKANAGDVCFHQQPQYGLNKSMSTHGIGASRTSTATQITFVSEQLNKSCVFKEENPLKLGHIGNTSNAMEVEHYVSISHADRSEHKESKVVKHFRASLVDFVKALVKPHWHNGKLSKDAHNTVVKKAVEKVLSALQSHQIPSTVESITQYISSSRPRLTKLVELYVRKYAKS